MAETCAFCGEVAVVEETVDGRDRKICVECGSLALSRPSSPVGLSNSPIKKSSGSVERMCMSCGDDLDLSLPSTIIFCSECAELEGQEIEQDDTLDHDGSINDETMSTVIESDKNSQGDNRENKSQDTHENGSTEEGENSVKNSFKNNRGDDYKKKLSIKTVISNHDKVLCVSCKSASLRTEHIGAEEKLVCVDCGVVSDQSDSQLVSDGGGIFSGAYGAMTLPYFSQTKQKPKGLIAGKEMISLLHQKLSIPNEVEADAQEMYLKAFYTSEFYRASIFVKEHAAAACLFVCCRVSDIPVSLMHFQPHVRRFSTFLKAKKRLLRCLDISLPHLSLSNKISHYLAGRNLDGAIIAKVRDILFLCRRAWLTQGRNRDQLINIAAYYAYLSSPSCQRHMHLKTFLDRFSLSSVSSSLSSEFSSFFVKLAQSIPWVRNESVKRTNVYVYLDDILKYQNSLIQLAFQTPLSTTKQNSLGLKRGHSSEKELLLPSIMKKPRMPPHPIVHCEVPADVNLDSPILNPSEFEKEINSYILSPEEQESVRELKIQNMKC